MNQNPSRFHQKALGFEEQTPGVFSINPRGFNCKSQAIQKQMPGISRVNARGFLLIYSPFIKVLQLYSISC